MQLNVTKATGVSANAKQAIKLANSTVITVLSSATCGEFLFSTNKGFAGRTTEWIVADWRKTVKSSRQYMQALVNAEDLQVYVSEPIACVTAEEQQNLHLQTAQVLQQYLNANYTCLSKIALQVQAHLQAVNTTANTAQNTQQSVQNTQTATQVQSYYNAVKTTTCLNSNTTANTATKAQNKRKAVKA